jgi:hypothetical protein
MEPRFCLVLWSIGNFSAQRAAANRKNATSVLFSQHDGDDALSDRRISWVGRVRGQHLIIVIDLEKDRLTIDLERAKVVFLVWIVGVAEIEWS